MSRTILLATVFAVLLIALPQSGPVAGETTSGDVAQKTKEAMNTFKAYMVEKKNDAVSYGKDLLEKTDEEIDVLQAKAADASEDTKEAYQAQIETLKEKRAAAARKLDQLGDASAESWDDAKAGFVEAYEALYDAYKEALTNFK